MTRNGPKMVTLRYGSIFIASDVIKAVEYMIRPWVCQAYLFGFTYLGLPTPASLTLEERLHQFLISFLYVQPGRAE